MPATLDFSAPLDDTFGALFVGVVVSAVLHGLCLLQVFLYFQKYKHDPWYIKYSVITVVCFDAMHLLLVSIGVYHYLVRHFHDPERLEVLTWSLLIEVLFPGINGAIVQTFYMLRIWRLSKRNYLLCGFLSVLILAEVASGTTWVIMSMLMKTFEDLLRLTPLSISINVLSTTVDSVISLSLCILLNKARTGFKRSDSIINKLIVFIVNTGLLTTTFAMSALICLVASPHTLIYAIFYFSIGRLYTNSFLATLNARASITAGIDETEMKPSSGAVTPRGTIGTIPTRSNNINIRIETTQEVDNLRKEGEKTLNEPLDSDEFLPDQKRRPY